MNIAWAETNLYRRKVASAKMHFKTLLNLSFSTLSFPLLFFDFSSHSPSDLPFPLTLTLTPLPIFYFPSHFLLSPFLILEPSYLSFSYSNQNVAHPPPLDHRLPSIARPLPSLAHGCPCRRSNRNEKLKLIGL